MLREKNGHKSKYLGMGFQSKEISVKQVFVYIYINVKRKKRKNYLKTDILPNYGGLCW